MLEPALSFQAMNAYPATSVVQKAASKLRGKLSVWHSMLTTMLHNVTLVPTLTKSITPVGGRSNRGNAVVEVAHINPIRCAFGDVGWALSASGIGGRCLQL